VNRSKFKNQEAFSGRQAEFKHTKWECKYIWYGFPNIGGKTYIPNCGDTWPWFRDLASQKESQVLEGHLKADHVHMLISIPPKYSVSQVVGFLKGKAPSKLRECTLEEEELYRQHFWARGYFVSTVGMNEQTIREYIRAQER